MGQLRGQWGRCEGGQGTRGEWGVTGVRWEGRQGTGLLLYMYILLYVHYKHRVHCAGNIAWNSDSKGTCSGYG